MVVFTTKKSGKVTRYKEEDHNSWKVWSIIKSGNVKKAKYGPRRKQVKKRQKKAKLR